MPKITVSRKRNWNSVIIDHLQLFLLEMGKGFTFVRRQYPITVNNRHYHCDLVFYHRILKCFVLIDLKRDGVQHEDIGQMNLYLNYFKHEVCTEGDNEPFGIVLGAEKDKLTVQYALEGITNQLFVSRYQLFLPDREALSREVYRIIEAHAESEHPEQK